MSNAEINQCVFDIKSWFTRNNYTVDSKANSSDFQKLEKSIDTELPDALKILLSEANGGLYFMDKKLLSTSEILEYVMKFEKSKDWKDGYIPFTSDGDTCLIINTRNDEIYEWECNDNYLGDNVSISLNKYLEDYRNDLLSGHFEFLDDVGVIEKMNNMKTNKK